VRAVADAWKSCYSCGDYREHRRESLAQPLADKARREGRDVIEVVDEFMGAAHERHLSGTPLREDGPTRVTNPLAGRILSTYALLGSMVAQPAEVRADQGRNEL
jgi:hypothetical protein